LTARGDEAGEEGVCLFVGDSFLVVDAAVQGDVDTEGQESHGILRSRFATRRPASGSKGTSPIREVLTLCRPTITRRPHGVPSAQCGMSVRLASRHVRI